MASDSLTTKEADYMRKIIAELKSVKWVTPMLQRLSVDGGLKTKNMPLLFELRYAYELHSCGFSADYEYRASVGDSTVEFRVPEPHGWLIELVSICKSQAVKKATKTQKVAKGIETFELELSSDAEDPRQSEEGEMLLVQQKIGEKVFRAGKPVKFPLPTRYKHLILVDMRGYLGDGGGDKHDYGQIAFGPRGTRPEFIHYWRTKAGTLEPIHGLFERSNPITAARYIQERIHFLGFICERKYEKGEIRKNTIYTYNFQIMDKGKASKLFNSYPLRRGREC